LAGHEDAVVSTELPGGGEPLMAKVTIEEKREKKGYIVLSVVWRRKHESM
jgi:hypothetical protein